MYARVLYVCLPACLCVCVCACARAPARVSRGAGLRGAEQRCATAASSLPLRTLRWPAVRGALETGALCGRQFSGHLLSASNSRKICAMSCTIARDGVRARGVKRIRWPSGLVYWRGQNAEYERKDARRPEEQDQWLRVSLKCTKIVSKSHQNFDFRDVTSFTPWEMCNN